MSRLGDLIFLERTRRRMTARQVAQGCGVAEKYLLEVESGKRIIADDQARRILKSIGLREHSEADFTLDEIAATVDLETLRTAPPAASVPERAPEPRRVASAGTDSGENKASGIWLDALAGVMKAVPVYNAAWTMVRRRLLPIENGRIESGAPDKVFYFLPPDDSLRGFRVLSGDLVLMAPAQSPVDDAIMLVEHKGRRMLRKVRSLDASTVMLQSYDREHIAEPVPVHDLTFAGRAVRIEIPL
jgi:transcriptional regulator with XRE-family HTH domain